AHTYKNLRIFGFESVLVLDANGKLLSESDSEQRANFVKADAAGPGSDFSVVPAISSKAAIDAALASLGASARHETPPSAELIIWPAMRTERVP
ncbi:M4 family peptidase, partial [Massilia sp. CT11-108]